MGSAANGGDVSCPYGCTARVVSLADLYTHEFMGCRSRLPWLRRELEKATGDLDRARFHARDLKRQIKMDEEKTT